MDDLIARIERQINLMSGRGMPLHESQARDLLRECKEALSSQWVSVKDRLPERKDRVIWYTPEIEENVRFRLATGDMRKALNSATHWMSLPLPPIEQEQEQEQEK